MIEILSKHADIHGVNVTIELLRISNIATKELVEIYNKEKDIIRIEKLTNVSKQKLWDKSKGADDRVAFCKAVVTFLHYYGK